MKRLFLLMAAVVAFVCNANAQNTKPISVEFQGSAHVGTIFDAYGAGPTLDVDAGAKFFDYLYAGLATGFHTYFAPAGYTTYWIGYIPLGVNLKGYFTKDKKVNPYINCTLGGLIAVSGRGGGFHCKVGAGVEVKRFSAGLGCNIVGSGPCGYINLGYRFGK